MGYHHRRRRFLSLSPSADLCAQHEESGNNVEAGLTLLLHAGLYNWTEQPIPPAGPFTTTDLAWQRKAFFLFYLLSIVWLKSHLSPQELLYFQAIDFFERGKGWEKAIDLMEELRLQYQEVFFDYEKLSNILVPDDPRCLLFLLLLAFLRVLTLAGSHKQARQARLFHSIVSEERIYPDYFFVGFYGKGFPPDIANKQYIFKGYELEVSLHSIAFLLAPFLIFLCSAFLSIVQHSREFQGRIVALWPGAEILTFTEAPDDDIKERFDHLLPFP